MSNEKTLIQEDAMKLLEGISQEMKEAKQLDTLNTKMIGVVKDLNEVRIEEITGKNVQG